MHSPAFAPAYFSMADAVRNSCLEPPLRELVILRVGHAYKASYELFHHERIARDAGLSEATIVAAGAAEPQKGVTELEQHFIDWTDCLLNNHTLDEASRRSVISQIGFNGLADLVFLVGFYQLVCNFLLSFDIDVERAYA
nr:carboxymuconolactone decarboxylase family protein [Candidimonas humi]